jgi:hypothetical protein
MMWDQISICISAFGIGSNFLNTAITSVECYIMYRDILRQKLLCWHSGR